jgi:hypothetical protein
MNFGEMSVQIKKFLMSELHPIPRTNLLIKVIIISCKEGKMKLIIASIGLILFALIEMPASATQETRSIGPYNIGFDLGQINHSVDTYHIHDQTSNPQYCLHILIPGYPKNTGDENENDYVKHRKNAEMAVWIEDGNNKSWRSWQPWYINANGTHSTTIDNIQGWIQTSYAQPRWITDKIKHPEWNDLPINYTATVRAEYRLEHRGNGATGVVEITGTSDNATLPYVMNLIKTIHVTETITTYTEEPVYARVPHYTTG